MSNIVKIPLTRGKFALIDSQDLELVSKFKWYLSGGSGVEYACARNPRKLGFSQWGRSVKMHRVILGITDPKIQVDHKDRDRLNNTRSNIRIVTKHQNMWNRIFTNNTLTSCYKGVSKRTRKNGLVRYVCKITAHGQTLLSFYSNEHAAALAYNDLAKIHHGEFAILNDVKKQINYQDYLCLENNRKGNLLRLKVVDKQL